MYSNNSYLIPQQGLYDSVRLPSSLQTPSVPYATTVTKPYPTPASNSTGMFSPSNPNFGSNIGNTGLLMNGLGGLYSAFSAKDYYDQTSDILDQQMGLYQQEIDRRNKTRDSYSTAFSQGA